MNTRIGFAALMMIANGAIMIPPVNAAELNDTTSMLLREAGEFELGNGESRVLVDRMTAEPYRICVHSAPHSIPLQVTFDNKTEKIAPGNCADVEGMRIAVAPAGQLSQDTILIGRFRDVG